MVGITGLWRAVARLSPRQRAIGGVLLLCVVAGIAWMVATATAQARLLRLDPDVASADPAAMRFALGRGRSVYDHNCASCHGVQGHGNVTRGIPDLTDKDTLYGDGLANEIETIVLYGIRAPNSKTWRLADMPAFGRAVPYPREPSIKPLSPGDIRDVMQFMASMRGAKFEPSAAGRGAALFSDRGGCYDCHSSDGHGDPAIGGPNLADNVWLYGGDDKTVFDSISKGRAGFCPAFVNRLSPAQVRETALYVYSLSHTPTATTRPK